MLDDLLATELQKALTAQVPPFSLKKVITAIRKTQKAGQNVDHLHRELSEALRLARPAEIDELLAAGADVHWVDSNGATALHYPIVPGSATRLIECGADPAAVDATGNTALHAAVAQNNGYLLRLLAELGVPNVKNSAGLLHTDLFVGSFELDGRASPVTNASVEAHIWSGGIAWEINAYLVDLVSYTEDEHGDAACIMQDARIYMETVHAWQGRRVDDWRDLLAEPLRWSDPLAAQSENCGMYAGSHVRLAESELAFSDATVSTCHASWSGSPDGGSVVGRFALECSMTFGGVTIDATTIDDAQERLEYYVSSPSWNIIAERGRFRAYPNSVT